MPPATNRRWRSTRPLSRCNEYLMALSGEGLIQASKQASKKTSNCLPYITTNTQLEAIPHGSLLAQPQSRSMWHYWTLDGQLQAGQLMWR